MGEKVMYNIRLLYDCKGWAYYWRCMALQKYAPSDFHVECGSDYGLAFKKKKHDLVLQLAYSYAKDLRNHMESAHYTFPLVSSYNVGWNYANKWLDDTIKYSDHVIINNYEMWDKAGRKKKTIYISNGVDREIFKVRKPIELRKPKVLWCGSECHRKTKNYDKILIPLSNMLKKYNIPFDFKLVNSTGNQRLTQEQMVYWYNTGSIYVCASETEGTPNPALEAASCGCTIVSTRVGNMPELIVNGRNGFLCDKDVKSIFNGIQSATENLHNLENNMLEDIKSWDWKNRSKEYYDFFRKVIEKC